MVEEGEFKKRIDTMITELNDFLDKQGDWDWKVNQAQGQRIMAKKILPFIDEAKRDYPSLLSLGLVPKLSEYDIAKINKARQEWFLKWFGSETPQDNEKGG